MSYNSYDGEGYYSREEIDDRRPQKSRPSVRMIISLSVSLTIAIGIVIVLAQSPASPPWPITGATSAKSCAAPTGCEFPDSAITISGPAIVEYWNPGIKACGIIKLDKGKLFTWSYQGHYWIFSSQSALDARYPTHLQQYRQRPHQSAQECPEGWL